MELPLHDRERDGVELREVDDSQDGVDGRSEPAVANCCSVDANIYFQEVFVSILELVLQDLRHQTQQSCRIFLAHGGLREKERVEDVQKKKSEQIGINKPRSNGTRPKKT